MRTEEKMTVSERRKCQRLIRKRYLKASKPERGCLLHEMKAATRLPRKSLVCLMSGSLERKPRHKPRGCAYGPEVDYPLGIISSAIQPE